MSTKKWRPRGRLRRIARRSAVTWWAAAITLGVITASVTNSALQRSVAEADAWGTKRRVWVVEREVDAGAVIGATDVELVQRPKGVVPFGALDGESSPIGEATRVALARGEVVLVQRLAGRGAHGLAALVPPGRRAIALRNDETLPSVRPGDRVDVIATFDVADAAEGSPDTSAAPSFAVASDAEVLSVSPRTITIAVAQREASRVAFALARAAVTVALRGGASEPTRSR